MKLRLNKKSYRFGLLKKNKCISLLLASINIYKAILPFIDNGITIRTIFYKKEFVIKVGFYTYFEI